MSETVSVSLGSISLPSDQAALLQAAADTRGKTIATLVNEGTSIQGLIQDEMSQAAMRLFQAGSTPQAILDEATANAAKVVAARATA
jgi:hypothetical protein